MAAHTGVSRKEATPRKTFRALFRDPGGAEVDDVLVTFFPRPHSYTGEDVVEISCHGSPVIARRILEELTREQARVATPGEFTLRAFLNRKLDLSQAEAVRDLIDSQTEFQARMAKEQLSGSLGRALESVRRSIVEVVSHLETALEFVEDDVSAAARKDLTARLLAADGELEDLEKSFRFGRIVHDGVVVVLAGKPNTGKSSIFNALAEQERAIVTEIPGTTRDALIEKIDLQGIPVTLIDTAGIRDVEDVVERIGVERAREHAQEADLVLFVLDQAGEFEPADKSIWRAIRAKPCLLVLNKADLRKKLQVPEDVGRKCVSSVPVSALMRTNLGKLSEALLEGILPSGVWQGDRKTVTNIRHQRCIKQARKWMARALSGLGQGLSEEFVSHDLRKVLEALSELTGETTNDEVLDTIFSSFCIGK
jgi:tRNA modification GTPase